MLRGGSFEIVTFGSVRDDRSDPLLGHLPVGLVLEALDVAGGSLEGDDRARGFTANEAGDPFERERIFCDSDVHVHPQASGCFIGTIRAVAVAVAINVPSSVTSDDSRKTTDLPMWTTRASTTSRPGRAGRMKLTLSSSVGTP